MLPQRRCNGWPDAAQASACLQNVIVLGARRAEHTLPFARALLPSGSIVRRASLISEKRPPHRLPPILLRYCSVEAATGLSGESGGPRTARPFGRNYAARRKSPGTQSANLVGDSNPCSVRSETACKNVQAVPKQASATASND